MFGGGNVDNNSFSCHSAPNLGLSLIDLVLGNSAMMPYVAESTYEPKLLSDHSPF